MGHGVLRTNSHPLEGAVTYFSMMGGLPNLRSVRPRKLPKARAKRLWSSEADGVSADLGEELIP
jgi:hypothetical protein